LIGSTSYIGDYKTSDVAAVVFILFELTMGLFIMESLRITRLFPTIGSMDDKMRRRILWIAFSLLAILAGIESALAFAGDRIAQVLGTLGPSMAGVEQSASADMIPAVGQMILSFIFPFALVFVTIPLESFVSSFRTVMGMLLAGAFRLFSFVLRLIGNIGYYTGRFVINLYDLLIFPSIWLEGVLAGSKTNKNDAGEKHLYEGRSISEEVIVRKKG
jgi:hypothetical protein